MSQDLLPILGIPMPADFPSPHFMRVHQRVCELLPQAPLLTDHYLGGWNGVAYRFLAMAHHDEEFTRSILEDGDAPPPPARARQELSLYGFFTNGLSCLETLCFALYVLGAHYDPDAFHISSDDELRAISIKTTAETYERALSSWGLSTALRSLYTAQPLHHWREIRNILTHRAAPGRIHYASTTQETGPSLWKTGIPLDPTTTQSRRQWLSAQLHTILAAAELSLL